MAEMSPLRRRMIDDMTRRSRSGPAETSRPASMSLVDRILSALRHHFHWAGP